MYTNWRFYLNNKEKNWLIIWKWCLDIKRKYLGSLPLLMRCIQDRWSLSRYKLLHQTELAKVRKRVVLLQQVEQDIIWVLKRHFCNSTRNLTNTPSKLSTIISCRVSNKQNNLWVRYFSSMWIWKIALMQWIRSSHLISILEMSSRYYLRQWQLKTNISSTKWKTSSTNSLKAHQPLNNTNASPTNKVGPNSVKNQTLETDVQTLIGVLVKTEETNHLLWMIRLLKRWRRNWRRRGKMRRIG